MSEQNPWDFSDFRDSQNSPQQPAQNGFGNGPSSGPSAAPPFAASSATPSTMPAAESGTAGPFVSSDGPFGAGALDASAPVPAGPPAAFGDSGPAAQLSTSRPPVQWLMLAAGLAIVGIVVAALLGSMPPVAIAAWVLAGPIGIGFLAFFTTSDLRARTGAVYLALGWVKPMYWVALVLCFAGAMVAAWRIAEWVGRL